MSAVTYFVVLPFARTEDGDLYADEAIEVPTEGAARRRAEAALELREARSQRFNRVLAEVAGNERLFRTARTYSSSVPRPCSWTTSRHSIR